MSDHDFNTPPDFLDLVRKLDPRGIGLDPCSGEHSLVCARTEYLESDNGLIHPWAGHGLVFMNPPHSHSPYNIEPWIEKVLEFWSCQDIEDQLVGLVPAKTDTGWFHSIAPKAEALCFLKGRIKYWHLGAPAVDEGGRPQSGKFASVVLYFGDQGGLFSDLFSPLGLVY